MENINDFKSIYYLLGSEDYESRLLAIHLLKESVIKNRKITYDNRFLKKTIQEICKSILNDPEYELLLNDFPYWVNFPRKFRHLHAETLYRYLNRTFNIEN